MPPSPSLPAQVTPPAIALAEHGVHAVLGVEVVAVPLLPPDPVPVTASGEPPEPGTTDDPGTAGPVLGPGAADLADQLGLDLLALAEAEGATGRPGEVVRCPVPLGGPENADLRLVLLVGVGERTPIDLRRAGATLARAVRGRDAVATSIASLTEPGDDAGLEAFVVGLMLGSFGFSWTSSPPSDPPVTRAVLAGVGEDRSAALDRAVAVGGAGWTSRTLATVPSNLKSPQWLAEQAVTLGEAAGLRVEVRDEVALAQEGFGGILAVGQASATPPRLVRLDYTPPKAGRRTPTVVLVGKGITFDSGGLSIKPAEAMTSMKRDMTGSAVVLGAMTALAAVGCPVRVVGLLACAENAVSGNALRPGDVIRHYGGRTTEVTNTDAEGRLVMADALAYAVAELDPTVLVDVATLTGAMKVALGQRTGGYFANDEALASALGAAGLAAGEPLWRMPLEAAYEDRISSSVADADNAGGGPGAITAALFLQHFVGGLPWAHLDVASVGDSPSEWFEWSAGPSGFGPRALLAWLGSEEPVAGVGE